MAGLARGRPARLRGLLRLYGPALAPFMPLVLLVSVLSGIALMSSPGPIAAPVAGRRLLVAGTDGAGVFLRNSPRESDRKAVVAEGEVLVEIGPSPNPGWRHVSVGDDGQTGWVPARYTKFVP